MKYLIWSNEHRAWWKGNRHGYTTATHKAGQFSYEEATTIVLNGNWPHVPGELTPDEVMVFAPSPDQIKLDLEYPDR